MSEPDLHRDLEAVAAALAAADRVVVASHENPDGDAIGSIIAAGHALRQQGKQVRSYLHADSPIPPEYAFLGLDQVERRIDPDSVQGWTLLALDCGNERRLGPDHEALRAAFDSVVDIDHHHDNSRFGQANLVDGRASSTAEILSRVFDAMGVEFTPQIAEALYVGLVTDTGRFQYRTTSPAALRLGARLLDEGADVHKVYELIYESVPWSKQRLLGRVLENARMYAGGEVLVSHVTREDLSLVTGDEATTEGLIDELRRVDGVQVAGLIREQMPLADGTITQNRVSLRSRGKVDVSEIARKSRGGGHKQAAGFSHPGTIDEIRDFIVGEVELQLAGHAA
jgi:phosphoesterase RecJ-like protein